MKEIMTGTYIYNEESFDFNFYKDLTTFNKLKFVNSVVDVLVDDGNYNSIIRNLIFDFFIIDIFTTVDTSELKKSVFFLDEAEKFLEETNIIDIVKANVKEELIEELNRAIDLNIEYKTGIKINSLNESLSRLFNTIEKKINEIDLDSMKDIAKVFSGITDEFTTENIVKAYMANDVHKNNLIELEEYKSQKDASVDKM